MGIQHLLGLFLGMSSQEALLLLFNLSHLTEKKRSINEKDKSTGQTKVV